MEVLYPAVEAVRGMAEAKQVELIFKCQDEPVEADVERLSQVVQNLLSNAIKFTPKWGKITLKSEEYKDCYRILVIDTGSGIKEEYLPKVFDRFQQVPQDSPQNKGGTGLGLAICKGIVEAHGGEIGVESLEGKGSTFWFTLPKLK
jgi:Signal transduction histidine kinase